MLRLDRNSENTEVGRPFVKMSINWYVQDADITDGNTFPDEVEIDLNMLYTLVLNGVGGEVDDVSSGH
jgi:hypothetical protein